jgi:hypothetical protein
MANRLDEAAGQLRVELATRPKVDAELEALWTSTVWVQDLVLGSADGPSSPVASMSAVAEPLKGRIDAAAASRAHWGSHSAVGAVMSHFLELEAELEVLGSGRSTDLTEDETDALWTLVHAASDSLVLHVAHNPPDYMRK